MLDSPCDYLQIYQKMLRLHELSQKCGLEYLLVLQHYPVFTVGNRIKPDHYPSEIGGIPVIHCDRGGDITLHNPGQLVFYPVIQVERHARGTKEFVERLENWVTMLLSTYGIRAGTIEGFPGVWVGDRKIASIGLRIKRGISYHGIALNVNNDLRPFDLIDPCGIKNCRMTSMNKELGRDLDLKEVAEKALLLFRILFYDRIE